MRALTPKQESFCQKIVELQGKKVRALQASLYSTDKTHKSELIRFATELLDKSIICDRIDQLRERALARHDVTIDTLTNMYMEAREMAIVQGDVKAVISAIGGIAKLHGLGLDNRSGDINIKAPKGARFEIQFISPGDKQVKAVENVIEHE